MTHVKQYLTSKKKTLFDPYSKRYTQPAPGRPSQATGPAAASRRPPSAGRRRAGSRQPGVPHRPSSLPSALSGRHTSLSVLVLASSDRSRSGPASSSLSSRGPSAAAAGTVGRVVGDSVRCDDRSDAAETRERELRRELQRRSKRAKVRPKR